MTTRTIAEGRAGAYQVAHEIRKAVRRGALHPLVRERAESLRRPSDLQTAQAIYDYVDRAIEYVNDPPPPPDSPYSYIDTLIHPPEVIEDYEIYKTPVEADCVTQSTLVASLAKALRIPARIKVLGNRDRFFHVFPELLINGRWVAADVTAKTAVSEAIRKAARLGFKANAIRELVFDV